MWYVENGYVRYIDDDSLMHYGVPGMKWGVRKKIQSVYNGMRKVSSNVSNYAKNRVSVGSSKTSQPKSIMTEKEIRIQKAKKAVKIGAVAAGTVLAAYGAYKIHKFVREANVQHHADIIAKTLEPLYQQGQAFGTGPLATLESRNSTRWGTATVAKGFAKNDSFGTALKNVTKDAIKRKTGRY